MNHRRSVFALALLLFAIGTLTSCSQRTADSTATTGNAATSSSQRTFGTPEEALTALIAALQSGDPPTLKAVLGPGSAELVSSGDPVADQREREAFLARYATAHELAAGDSDHLVLLVGDDRWPLPIPLVRRDGQWSFDAATGAEEIVYRRIGGNELHTINVMRGYVEAQNEYAASAHDSAAAGSYAQKLRSDPGTHNGLYWQVAAGQAPSPAGPLLAAATAENYGGGQAGAAPYHGYLYRMLLSQGPAAPGGAHDYLTQGKLIGGFALLAYPATYGASGIMTFMVSQDGIVWQRDLGKNTTPTASAFTEFNPDDSWTPIAPEG